MSANPFAWRGASSIFAQDPAFAGRVQGGTGVAKDKVQPMPGTRFPGKSINTEKVPPKDKTRLIQRGNAR